MSMMLRSQCLWKSHLVSTNVSTGLTAIMLAALFVFVISPLCKRNFCFKKTIILHINMSINNIENQIYELTRHTHVRWTNKVVDVSMHDYFLLTNAMLRLNESHVVHIICKHRRFVKIHIQVVYIDNIKQKSKMNHKYNRWDLHNITWILYPLAILEKENILSRIKKHLL